MEIELELPKCLYELADALDSPLYVVGGYIRNHLSGLSQTDIDICGTTLPQAMNLPQDFKVRVINFRLGTALIIHKKTGKSFEYTPFRIEKYSNDGSHKPVDVGFTLNINVDCMRRDFTCNSLYYNIKEKRLIDLCNGVEDIKNKIIRARSINTFNFDGLRLLRLVRLAAETGFSLDMKTAKLAKENAHKISSISAERIRNEFSKIILADEKYGIKNAHFRGLKLLDKLDILDYFLHQLCECKQCDGLDYNLFDRSLQIFKNCPPNIRLAGLLCDIGYKYIKDKNGNVYCHDTASELIAKDIMTRLKYDNETINYITSIIRWHMYDSDNNTGENKLKLFVAKHINIIDGLIALKKAIAEAMGIPYVDRLEKIHNYIIDENVPCSLSELVINGDDFLENGIEGKEIGKTLNDILNECIINPKLNNLDSLLKIVKKKAVQFKTKKMNA